MNVINDNWLNVEYLDGTVAKVSVRQAFVDAKKIKDLKSPIFHGYKVYIYDVPVVWLLSTILKAAYFKPENNFAARNKYFSSKLMKDGWDEKIILDYLDKWEYKFNLFDDKYPFLQDISLKTDKVDKKKGTKLGYISNNSVIAPGQNNVIFEHTKETNNEDYISNFVISEIDELIYILLYNITMGTSPMPAQYFNKSLSANMTMFILNKGSNLFETIIHNSLPLRDSFCDDDLYDKPVWELDDYSQIKDYGAEIYKNVLLCTFLPLIPLYIVYDKESETVQNIIIPIKKLVSFFTKDELEAFRVSYMKYHPWAIREGQAGTKPDKYKQWSEYLKIINLCFDITKKLPSGYACNLINPTLQENRHASCIIYYRQYLNKEKTLIGSFGNDRIQIPQDTLNAILENDETVKRATEYQKLNIKILDNFKFYKAGIPSHIIRDSKREFSKRSESYFLNTFIPNINSDDVMENARKELVQYAKELAKKIEKHIRSPLKYAVAYQKLDGVLFQLLNPKKKGDDVKNE